MPVVVDERCGLHDPGGEVWVGVRTPGTELPDRLEAIRAALSEAGATFVAARRQPDEELKAVHDPRLLDYLAGAWEEWERSGLTSDPGQDRVVPYVFAHAALTSGRPPTVPVAPWARPGYFAYDTMTLVGPGTWQAARAAVDAALTAAALALDESHVAYACVRPPGHHVTRSCYGGSCYLNTAAVAASYFARRMQRVGVLDIDAHHGNGTQEIYYERPDVVVASLHVDPAAGWFPHFLGHADETGARGGEGANRNVPLAPGSGDETWLAALEELVGWLRAAQVDALVVPLGVDAAAGDPESPLQVTPAGFRKAGRMLATLGLPTVLVQESGYDLATLGVLVREVLLGFEETAQ
jgi:acetoin utilization deacetylase AcuC-like enzyme